MIDPNVRQQIEAVRENLGKYTGMTCPFGVTHAALISICDALLAVEKVAGEQTERISYAEVCREAAEAIALDGCIDATCGEASCITAQHNAAALRALANQLQQLQAAVAAATVGDKPFAFLASNPTLVRPIVVAAASLAAGFSLPSTTTPPAAERESR